MAVDLGTARGKIELDTSGVDAGLKKTQSALGQFGGMASKAMLGIGVAVAGVSSAVAVMGKAWQTFERGAQIDAMENRFERLADSIGSSGDVLMSRLKEATNGMMTSAQLMENATDIMSLGLGKTEDQTVRLASVVGKLGWDMSQTVLTFANNSKMRLDALGLSVEDVEKRTAALRETGMSLDTAFDLAVIEAGEAKIELLGDASQTTAGKLQILKTAVAEARDAFATTFTDELVGQIEAVAGSTEALAAEMEHAAVGAAKLAASTTRPFLNLLVGVGKMEEVRALGQEYQRLGGDIATLQSKYQALFSGRLRGAEEDAAVKALEEEIALLQIAYNKLDAYNRIRYAGSDFEQNLEDATERRRRAQLRADEAGSRMALNLGAPLLLVGERFKDATLGGGKFGDQLDAVTAKAAQTQAALDAAAQRAQAYASAFGEVQGDYTTELPGADEPLVSPERTVNVTTQISGPTEAQRQAVTAYTDALERLREKYFDLTNGVGTFGMEQGKLDEAIAETAGEIAHYEGLLAGIPPAVNDVSTSQQGLKVNVDAVRQAIYDQLVAMVEAGEATPEVATAYAVAVGIMGDAQREAALQAAVVKLKIDELAASIAAGMPIDKALADLDAFILKMEQGVTPTAQTMATDVPLAMAPLSEEMSTQATAAGEAVPTNIAAGITDNLEAATTAATDAADAITQAVRDAHGIESPSSVFAEIGGQDIAGFVQGVADAQGDAVAAMEAVGQATVDAWDETIAAADGIGVSIMDGVIAGVESRRGALIAKMQEIAREAYAAAMAELEAKSPSRLFMQMGRAIIDGVVAGLDAEKDTLYGKLAEVANTLYGIGNRVFGLQSDALANNLDRTTAQMVAAFDALRGQFGDIPINNLLEMSPSDRAYFLRSLRGAPAYANIDVRLRLDEAIRLADERNRLEEEYIRQQEELAALEEQRSRLDFLQTQVDLLELIRENKLSTNILDGLTLGLDANMTDILAAMTEAVRQLIERANSELQIASPSAVFRRIGERVMEGLAAGLAETAEVQRRMRDALGRVTSLGLADTRALQGRLQAGLNQAIRVDAQGINPVQQVTVYGGFNVAMEGRPSADPLRELYFAGLGYQRG